MAIMIVAIIASIALVKSHRKKSPALWFNSTVSPAQRCNSIVFLHKSNNAMVQCHRFILAGYYDVAIVIYSTANTEDPYYSTMMYMEPHYSTVSIQKPDALR